MLGVTIAYLSTRAFTIVLYALVGKPVEIPHSD